MQNILIKLELCQLTSADVLEEAKLKQIAELLYDTDEYISEALFINREQAVRVLAELLKGEDPLFDLDNIFAATIDDEIVGILLWNKGPLCWSSAELRKTIMKLDEEASPYIEKAEREYFHSYQNTDEDTIDILFLCVREQYRKTGIATKLMNGFINSYSGNCKAFELYVLENNKAAIPLYLSEGFEIERSFNGFSIDDLELPCLLLKRDAPSKG